MANQCIIPNNAYSPSAYKISDYRFFLRLSFLVCIENNLRMNPVIFVELLLNNCFEVHHIDKLILD